MFNILSLKNNKLKKKNNPSFIPLGTNPKNQHNTTKTWISLPTGPSDHATSCKDFELLLQSHSFTALDHKKSF